MKGLVIRQNDISDSHTCSYVFTDSHPWDNGSQGMTDFGLLSQRNKKMDCKVEGGAMIREALRKTIEKECEEFLIYNLTNFTPQLEISRLPHKVREEAYRTKEYRIIDNPSEDDVHDAQYLSRSAIEFIGTNYDRFVQPVNTEVPPRPIDSTDECDSPEFFVYTDASYHPHRNKTGISIVIIGENGGIYSFAREVNPQVISRAELLAFNLGIKTVREIKEDTQIIAHTDSKDVSRSAEGEILIDEKLQNELDTYMDSTTRVEVNCISREANQLADAMAKLGRRKSSSITIGSLL